MICPVCGLKNDDGELKCVACGMFLLNYPLVSVNDIERYKTLLEETVNHNNGAFEIQLKVLLRYKGDKTSIVIPRTVEILGDHCFTKAPKNNIEEVIIHKNVKCINSFSTKNSPIPSNNGAFDMCKSLKRVIFDKDSTIQEIGRYAFYNCANLESIIGLPNHPVFIGRHAFSGCSKDLINEIAKHKNYIFEGGWND